MAPYSRPRRSRPAAVRRHSLIHARDLVITNGNFTQNIIYGRRTGKGMKALYKNLRVESNLFYDAQVHLEGGFIPEIQNNPQTHALKLKVEKWIRERALRTIWVYGSPTSTAKVAQHLAHELRTGDLLLGTVFIPPSRREEHAIHTIVPTIAYQIALAIPETRAFIASAIKEDPSVLERSLDFQIQHLVQGPESCALSRLSLEAKVRSGPQRSSLCMAWQITASDEISGGVFRNWLKAPSDFALSSVPPPTSEKGTRQSDQAPAYS